jgi:hypothetical protein
MLLLTGEYQHAVDDKGRVLVSNKLRNQIDAEEHGVNFYLVLGANGILCLYPEKDFERLVLSVLRRIPSSSGRARHDRPKSVGQSAAMCGAARGESIARTAARSNAWERAGARTLKGLLHAVSRLAGCTG